MVTGGIGEVSSSEIDPESETWVMGADMTQPRYLHTTTLLADGRVLLVGGQGVDEKGDRRQVSNTTEIYGPE